MGTRIDPDKSRFLYIIENPITQFYEVIASNPRDAENKLAMGQAKYVGDKQGERVVKLIRRVEPILPEGVE